MSQGNRYEAAQIYTLRQFWYILWQACKPPANKKKLKFCIKSYIGNKYMKGMGPNTVCLAQQIYKNSVEKSEDYRLF
jgi:hypothetical protein